MRIPLILASIFGIAALAAAEDLPTMHQCKSGWKSKYRSVWTESDFKKACVEILKSGKP